MNENAGSGETRARFDAVIVGAGPAGLATSYELRRRGIGHVVLHRGGQVGATWADLYDSLVLHTGRHMSHLPGMRIPRSVPLFPPREAFLHYLGDYARRFDLPIRTGVDVSGAVRRGGHWMLTTSGCGIEAKALVMATGIVASPNVPAFEGREVYGGRLLHSADYRRPADVPGKTVLVVGAGNSGGEIASELALSRRAVDVAVRSGANVVPLTLAGIPIQYLSHIVLRFPRPVQDAITAAVKRLGEWRRGPSPLPPGKGRPLDMIPLIGFHLVDAINAGQIGVRAGVVRLTEDGAVFGDGTQGAYDAIVLATGFSAALAPLGGLVRRDAKGFALRDGRVASADHPGLFFVGQNYDARGAIYNIAQDAGLAAEAIARHLAQPQGRN